MLVNSIFSFSHDVLKSLYHQDCENLGLCGKEVQIKRSGVDNAIVYEILYIMAFVHDFHVHVYSYW